MKERDWVFEMKMAHSGGGDWFTSHLLRLMVRADQFNLARLELGFPDHVAAHRRWQNGQGEFAKTLDGTTTDKGDNNG